MSNKKYEFVIFYEHVDREYEIAQILEKKISNITNKKGIILSIIFQRHLLLSCRPKLIIFPSLSWTEIGDIYKLYDSKIDIVSLNYEQMLSTFNKITKAPEGEIVKKKILHFAWSENYYEYLCENGVLKNNIKIVDKYVYQLVREKNGSNINSYEYIRKKYDKVIFVPLTDLQAFKSNERIKKEFSSKQLYKEAIRRRDFVLESIQIILNWIYNFAKTNTSVCFIVRPHPSVGIEKYKILRETMGLQELSNVIYNYEGAAVDFFKISDILITNYSSLILDADYCGIRGIILEPLAFPANLSYDWLNNFNRVTSYYNFNQELYNVINETSKTFSYNSLQMSTGIDDAARRIYEWSAKLTESHKLSTHINILNILNYKLIRFFMTSIVRLAMLRYFRLSLAERFIRDGIKV